MQDEIIQARGRPYGEGAAAEADAAPTSRSEVAGTGSSGSGGGGSSTDRARLQNNSEARQISSMVARGRLSEFRIRETWVGALGDAICEGGAGTAETQTAEATTQGQGAQQHRWQDINMTSWGDDPYQEGDVPWYTGWEVPETISSEEEPVPEGISSGRMGAQNHHREKGRL